MQDGRCVDRKNFTYKVPSLLSNNITAIWFTSKVLLQWVTTLNMGSKNFCPVKLGFCLALLLDPHSQNNPFLIPCPTHNNLGEMLQCIWRAHHQAEFLFPGWSKRCCMRVCTDSHNNAMSINHSCLQMSERSCIKECIDSHKAMSIIDVLGSARDFA